MFEPEYDGRVRMFDVKYTTVIVTLVDFMTIYPSNIEVRILSNKLVLAIHDSCHSS